ncbi:aromatase/cyclase [Streptomyces sp. NPDC047315]|uniref:aromatase/cyclase n=1 Tax=Streptomyces sp. NPDC047315 TaxID=3155142 RepID=UPI00340BEBE4
MENTQHTEHTVTAQAPQSVVWEVLTDIENYPNLFGATKSAVVTERGEGYEIARLEVDVSGQLQAWTTRRDLNPELGVVAYRQLETAPLVEHMSGEWRALPYGPDRTQVVLTHDFAARQEGADGKVAGEFTHAEAHRMLSEAVERNSTAHLAAVRDEAERRAARAKEAASWPR